MMWPVSSSSLLLVLSFSLRLSPPLLSPYPLLVVLAGDGVMMLLQHGVAVACDVGVYVTIPLVCLEANAN